MEKIFTNCMSCISGLSIYIRKYDSEKRRSSSKLETTLLLIVAFLTISNGLLKAQCAASAPYINVSVNPIASNITTTTVDISSVTAVGTWQWMDWVGVVWSTSTGSTITTHLGINETTLPSGSTMSGTMPAFTISGLTPGTTYYLRGFGTYDHTSETATCYGTEISFTTLPAGPISMTTTGATGISASSASTGGTASIISGTPTITERGVVYSTSVNPTTASGTKVITGSGAGTYTSSITGLASNTTYHVRAYSIDGSGNVYYGSDQVFTTSSIGGVISPYALTPDWYFGTGGRLTFPNGNFPSSAAPTPGNMPTNTSNNVEASTSISFSDGTVAIYTNTMQVYNGNPANVSSANFIRNLSTDNTCAGSSTGGGVTFPDPASPTNAFYLVTGNDETGGACQYQGVNRYRFTGTGTSVVYNAGSANMAVDAFEGEAITTATDGAGGHYVIIHSKSTTNTFRVWHYTASGISASTDYTPTVANVSSTSGTQSYLKISPCQDKIAYHSGGILVVNNFDRTTGTVGSEILRTSPANYGAGLEFSKDGSKIFYSGQGSQVYYIDIATATTNPVTGATSWSMQLGPDGNIYTSPGGSATVGIISNTTTTPSYSTTSVTGSATLFRGLSNISWLNPSLPVITASSGCPTVNFSYVFSNYFNTAINVVAGSEMWDFGEGLGFQAGLGATPTHTFSNRNMTYTVRVQVTDANCNQTWIGTQSVTLSCPLPVTLINFTGFKNEGVTNLVWNTTSEINNDYFDIQRSDDGINFYSIGQVKGNGSTSSISSYSFDDVNASNNIHYYRLAQHDIDGKITYSSIIVIKSEIPAPVVSPNPFTTNFTITFAGNKNVEIKVLDLLGRIVEKMSMAENTYAATLGEELSKGSYVVCVTCSTGNYYYKIIKE